jgi:hypothetical protein
MPWTCAQEGSWWEVSGGVPKERHSFTDCLARVLPSFVTGSDEPTFEVMVYGAPFHVAASAITRARELILVDATNPREAYYDRDQDTLDRSHSCGE